MKQGLKKIVAFALVGLMLVSTMGFSVNTLYCFCMDKFQASLFNIDHHCEGNHQENTFAADEALDDLPPCCKKAMACHKTTEEKDDCTKRDTKHVKADLHFLEIQKEEIADIQWVISDDVPQIVVFSAPYFYRNNLYFSSILTRPPPQYLPVRMVGFGRNLLNFIQVYRC